MLFCRIFHFPIFLACPPPLNSHAFQHALSSTIPSLLFRLPEPVILPSVPFFPALSDMSISIPVPLMIFIVP
ncbi:MAG: hypothetical protein BYD32DRAFT_408102 [Podila humilis]|nr:MAG: hypothetical protein BYD32DRAFT_408102 [Podila humilis]